MIDGCGDGLVASGIRSHAWFKFYMYMSFGYGSNQLRLAEICIDPQHLSLLWGKKISTWTKP